MFLKYFYVFFIFYIFHFLLFCLPIFFLQFFIFYRKIFILSNFDFLILNLFYIFFKFYFSKCNFFFNFFLNFFFKFFRIAFISHCFLQKHFLNIWGRVSLWDKKLRHVSIGRLDVGIIVVRLMFTLERQFVLYGSQEWLYSLFFLCLLYITT